MKKNRGPDSVIAGMTLRRISKSIGTDQSLHESSFFVASELLPNIDSDAPESATEDRVTEISAILADAYNGNPLPNVELGEERIFRAAEYAQINAAISGLLYRRPVSPGEFLETPVSTLSHDDSPESAVILIAIPEASGPVGGFDPIQVRAWLRETIAAFSIPQPPEVPDSMALLESLLFERTEEILASVAFTRFVFGRGDGVLPEPAKTGPPPPVPGWFPPDSYPDPGVFSSYLGTPVTENDPSGEALARYLFEEYVRYVVRNLEEAPEGWTVVNRSNCISFLTDNLDALESGALRLVEV
jgi:hypothetical protein